MATFGLGAETGPVDIEVIWPNGDITLHTMDAVEQVQVIRSLK